MGQRIGSGFNSLTEQIEKSFKYFFGGIGSVFSFVGSLVVPKSVTKKLNRATKSTSKSVGKRVGSITDQVEKRFSKGASGVFSTFGHIFRVFVPKSLLDWLDARWKSLGNWASDWFKQFAKRFEEWAERNLPKWMVNFGKAASVRSRRAWRTTSKFTSAWWQSRDYKSLAWSLPAFVLVLPLLSSLVWASVYDRNAKTTHYMRTMLDSLQEKDYKTAEICQLKLSQLGYHRIENAEFRSALALERDGDVLAAYEKMKPLAPIPDISLPSEDTTTSAKTEIPNNPVDENPSPAKPEAIDSAPPKGFAPAHLWIAMRLLNLELPANDEAERWRLMKAHADAALALSPKNQVARYLQVKFLERTGQAQKAIKTIIQLAGDYPEFNGELMEHYLNTSQISLAKLRARSFIAYAKSKEPDRLFAIDWAFWAKAHALFGEDQEAAAIAREGGRRFPTHPDIQRIAAIPVMAELAVANPEAPDYVDLLCEAHEMDPDNPSVINRIASRLTFDPIGIDHKIEEMKERNSISPKIFLASGEMHLRGGRVAEAVQKFEQAITLDDTFAEAYNNMAWVLSNREPRQLQAALVAANKAVELDDQSSYRETRGQIQYQLENYPASLADLEIALNGFLGERDRLNAHKTLSFIYERLGKKELAKAHAMRAQ